MKNLEDHKKIAVLIDADNAQASKMKDILDELSVHGHLVVKKAYGDWSSANLKKWKDILNELAIQPVQQFSYTTGKNSTDVVMVIDAMDLLYSDKFDAFALVSSDSDFTRLAARLRESERFVFGIGEEKTPASFRSACDDFLLVENLGLQTDKPKSKSPLKDSKDDDALILILQAWELSKDETGLANLGAIGQIIKRQKPDFDPRSYGVRKLSDLVDQFPDKLKKVRINHEGGGASYSITAI